MKPIEFPQQTIVHQRPAGWEPKECAPLPTYVGEADDGKSIVISCLCFMSARTAASRTRTLCVSVMSRVRALRLL